MKAHLDGIQKNHKKHVSILHEQYKKEGWGG
jgi:hypothetical protein